MSERANPDLLRAVHAVIVMELDGTVRDLVGPFYEFNSAVLWAERNVARRANLRFAVHKMTERGLFESAEDKRNGYTS